MRALLIINEVSGPGEPNTSRVEEIRACLGSSFDLEVAITSPERGSGVLAREAVERGFDAVIVGGGDGTVGPAAAELVGKKVPLGVLPLGTFNNIARSLELPAALPAACAIIAEGGMREIDVGQVKNGPYFFESAGAGLDAALFPLGEEIKGGRWGRLARFARLTMRYSAHRIRLTFDRTVAEAQPAGHHLRHGHRFSRKTLAGRTVSLRALLVAIANGPYYGGGFSVAPDASLVDGLLTVAVYRNFSKMELIRHFLSISRGQRKYSPKVEVFHAAEVHLSASRPLAVHLDGVPHGEAPITLRALPRALKVFAPEAPVLAK